MFRSEKDNPPLPRNAAPYSGAVTWLRSLRSRIMGPPSALLSQYKEFRLMQAQSQALPACSAWPM